LAVEGEEPELKNNKARGMRGFGGGISICEGRHLASAELKTMLVLALSAFDITPLYSTTSDGVTPLPTSSSAPAAGSHEIKGAVRPVISPRKALERPGLGSFQFDGLSDVIVKVRRRS